jgi:hypothetical protein
VGFDMDLIRYMGSFYPVFVVDFSGLIVCKWLKNNKLNVFLKSFCCYSNS